MRKQAAAVYTWVAAAEHKQAAVVANRSRVTGHTLE